MHLLSLPLILHLLPLTVMAFKPSHPEGPQHIFSNPSSPSKSEFNIPTVHESAVLARRILHLSSIGTLSTIFPSSSSHHTQENRPQSVAGTPIGLMDYVADCEPSTGNPTLLSLSIATTFKNVHSGSNISLSLSWVPPPSPSHHLSLPTSSSPYTTGYLSSLASLPRFSLTGYLEPLTPHEIKSQNIKSCFTKKHADAKWWTPGNKIHESEWVRLVVQEVYWIGGFGDRAYIGWIPVEEWRGVTEEEREGVRLPGEKTRGKEEGKGWGAWEL